MSDIRIVKTQVELDAAGKEWVAVEQGRLVARENSHVEARENSHVEARANSHVVARENSHVEARANSHVEARENSHVVARANSHVVAWENSHVVAWDNSHVVARANSHVVARANSHVEAWDNSYVEAWDNSHVDLYDFASAHVMSDRAQIRAVSPQATISRIIYPDTVEEWAALKGIGIDEGSLALWKAVSSDGTDYRTGQINYLGSGEIVAPDWKPNYAEECGYGLHLADSPEAALSFVAYETRFEARLLRVRAKVEDCRVFGGQPSYPCKLRARACTLIEEVPHRYQRSTNKEV